MKDKNGTTNYYILVPLTLSIGGLVILSTRKFMDDNSSVFIVQSLVCANTKEATNNYYRGNDKRKKVRES